MQKSEYYKYIEKNDAYRRLNVRNTVIGGLLFLAAGVTAFNVTRNIDSTSAANLGKFQAGYIMSDFVMTNYNSMTEAQIQTFLKSKNPCNNRNIAEAKKYPTVTYHIKDGHYVCMADDTFDNNGKKETAAHIIWQAAQDYKINPQVLIVLLEKEQGLVTDTWPHSGQYKIATGFGCPDTAACNSKYYGFRNQIRNAANLFHTVMTGGWTNYPIGNNYIQYNPNKSCGGSTVYVKNLATSALYRYTPYQPNKGALAAYTGTASCGAYGNRNFFIFFEDWFGNITATVDERIYSEFRTFSTKLGTVLGDYKTIKIANENVKKQEFKNGVLLEVRGKVYQTTTKISEVWEKNGQALGMPTGSAQKNTSTGMEYQAFEKGYIQGNDKKGYYISMGGSRAVWKKYGYESGALGFPTSDIQTNTTTGMQYQTYEKGVIQGNDEKGWFISMGGSRAVWKKYNYESGILGFPTSDIQTNTSTGMQWQTYDNGVIQGNDKKGWFISMGPIREKWKKTGYESGALGYPTSDIQTDASTGVQWQTFNNGVIGGDEKNGWFIFQKGSFDVWKKSGYGSGVLGYPTADLQTNKSTGMQWQTFEHGMIQGNDKKGWHISMGGSRAVWKKYGYEGGILGYPTSDIQTDAATSMQYQTYEHGVIQGNDEKGWFVFSSGSRNVWKKYNYEKGILGYPTTDLQTNKSTGMQWQTFEHGMIQGNDKKGWYISMGSIREKWKATGYEGGSFGFPKSDILTDKNGKKYQKFEGGTIYE